ncbi:spondin domain-containing protein [Pontimicrobium aquaticum]|uniref:Spondin_N n=1 Tax=Pontimicrobium aquaticum TaxID=2565367 RepID=A0A4U0EMB6_9FLAO|nr:spondin domain-containing protein [Pontimicrobium aquaticum]TJY32184.1 hypothetical protein E5167_14585 [Pontimicrobium aquaticum]
MKKLIFGLLATVLLFASCSDDDNDSGFVINESNFTVLIENVFQPKGNFNSGSTGFISPGESETITFNAGKGHFLQLATMFVQSNDLFYAPSDMGIPLYDQEGVALTGDITSMFNLWDAGTEVNEEPGIGENQAPRQSGANTGIDENGTVRLVSNVGDGFVYPSNESVINISLAHDGGTEFTLTLSNISGSSVLPTPLAPGAWAIHGNGEKPIFEENTVATSGLEGLAEDGANTELVDNLDLNTGLVSPFAPGAYNIGQNTLFTIGSSASAEMEALGEDGNVSGFTNVYNTPDGASAPGPIFPGQSYSFSFNAANGDALSIALMLVQSNDWVIALDEISLFNNGIPVSGNVTNLAQLLDVGTETDEYVGAGNNQAPRQSGPDTGADENGNVVVENNTASIPSISDMIKITIMVDNN